MISQRQFFRTKQTCKMVEDAVRQQFAGIKGLSVFIDRDAEPGSSITVNFDHGTADEEAVTRFIDTLPTYIR